MTRDGSRGSGPGDEAERARLFSRRLPLTVVSPGTGEPADIGRRINTLYPPTAQEPGPTLNLVYFGAVLLAVSVVTLGIGLLRKPRRQTVVAA